MRYDNYFDKILSSANFLSKIDYDAIDLNKLTHREALAEVLYESGLSKELSAQLVANVSRIVNEEGAPTKKAKKRRDDLGLTHIAYGFYSKTGELPITHKRDGEEFRPATTEEYEEVAKERGDEGSRSARITPDSDAKEQPTKEPENKKPSEDEEEKPMVQAKPRPGNSPEARKAAEFGSVAAELAVDYEDSKEDREELEARDQEN